MHLLSCVIERKRARVGRIELFCFVFYEQREQLVVLPSLQSWGICAVQSRSSLFSITVVNYSLYNGVATNLHAARLLRAPISSSSQLYTEIMC